MAKLGIDQLGDVLHLLKKNQVDATRYHPLGLSLGLSDNTLKVIERDHRGDTARCLSECLSAWLRKADSEDDPSWDILIAALRSIGEQAVADGIDEERKQSQAVSILSSHQISLSQFLIDRDPVFISVGDLLNKEKVLSKEALANIQSARRSERRRLLLLAAVKEAVQINYHHLETFGTVLCRCSNTNNVRLGKIILKDYRALITERSIAEEMEDDDQMFNTDTPSSETLPTSPNVKVHIPQCMSPEFSSIRTSFGKMFYNVHKIITKSPPSLEELKVFLEYCFPFLESQLADINDLCSLLKLIKKHCTLIDIKPLDAIVHEFTITEAERYIEEYKTTLNEFCQSISIELCLNERFEAVTTHPFLRCETATYVFDWKPEEHTLKDITDILSKASGRLVKISYIERVCSITITCTFPHSLIVSVMAETVENLEMLKESRLMEVTIGYCRIWKREDKIEVEIEDWEWCEAKLQQEKRVKEDLHRGLNVQQTSEDITLKEEERKKANRKILNLTEENARLQASLEGSAHHEDEIQRLNLEVTKLRQTNEVLIEHNEEQLQRIHQLAHKKEGIAAQKKEVEVQSFLPSLQTAPVNDKRVSDLKAQVDHLHSWLQQQELEIEALREANRKLTRRCEEYAHEQLMQNQLPTGSTHQHRFYLGRMRDYDNLKARYDKLDSEKEEVARELAKTTRRSRGERETYDKERKEWQRRENELALINHQRDSEIQELRGQLSASTRKSAPQKVLFSKVDAEAVTHKSRFWDRVFTFWLD